MTRNTHTILIACLWALIQTSCIVHSLTETGPEQVAPMEGYGVLDKFAFREAWYGMYFKEDKIGYSHFKIEPSGDHFALTSDAAMRLATPKKTDEIQMKERVVVRPDLSLMGFQSAVRKNGEVQRMTGKVDGDRLVIEINSGGRTESHQFPIEGKIFYQQTISLIPALKGLRDGATYSFAAFNPGTGAIDKVEQQVFLVRGSPGPKGAVWKLKTDIDGSGTSSRKPLPGQDKARSQAKNNFERTKVSSWLDQRGLTVLEKDRDGSLITLLQDKSVAEDFAAGNGSEKDLTLD
jgi:hypothetical protein